MKFDFEEINLIPNKCIVESRSECDTSIKLGNKIFQLPIVPANMECVINQELAIKLSINGYFYIMHRFDIDVIEFIKTMNSKDLVTSISIGVNKDSYFLIDSIIEQNLNVDYITIDIAHGHSVKMQRMLNFLNDKMPKSYIIAGNVSTLDGVEELSKWGADMVKVGIGPGSACTTWPNTGFGSRNCQASSILDCSKSSIPIMADGGIKVPGDITKSLVLGSTITMIGGMLSGFNDSPGTVVEYDSIKYKEFWGSASKFQSGKENRIEGKKILVEYKDKSILDEMIYLKECLQSSISYGGGKDIFSLKNVKWK